MSNIGYVEHAKLWLKLVGRKSFRKTDVIQFIEYLHNKKMDLPYTPHLVDEILKAGVVGTRVDRYLQ